MKVGLLSDLHGNHIALDAVLRAASDLQVEKLLCCGDYVGYYYHPDVIFSKLQSWEWHGVRGNHENLLEHWMSGNAAEKAFISNKYGSGIETASRMPEKYINQISNLPESLALKIQKKSVLLCHGSPWDLDYYVYPDAPKEDFERIFCLGFDLVVLGHTHYPLMVENRGAIIVNPGSVGQPRNGSLGAYWAIWDTDKNEIALQCEEYDVTSVLEDCLERDPSVSYLRNVLTRGLHA